MGNSRALASREREMQAKRLGGLAKALLLTAATVLTFVTTVLLVADHLYRPDSFVIDQLRMKGNFNHVKPEQVQETILKQPIGNFFSVELDQIKKRVETLPWVESADVRREWPQTLTVSVREHRPVMRWNTLGNQLAKGEQWVSATGEVITLEEKLDRPSSIVLTGADHESQEILRRALQWKKALRPSGIAVSEVTLSASRAWTLKLSYLDQERSFELFLGREEIDQRLARFQMLFDRQFRHSSQALLRVDARYPDGLAIEAEELAVPEADEAVTTLQDQLLFTRLIA